MNRKSSSSAPRTPNIRKPALPQLTKLRGHSETPTNFKSDLNSYALVQDNSFNLNSVRKFFTPTNVARTAIPSSFRIDTEFKEELSTRPAAINSFWEIKERTESYEMRIKSSLKKVTEEFSLWNKCCQDISPLIKQHSPDLCEIFTKLTGNFSNLFKELEKESQDQRKKSSQEIQSLKKNIKSLEEEAKSLQSLINSMKNSERLELEQIQKEIDELFGPDDLDSHLSKLKKSTTDHGVSTAEYLKEVYNTMNKEFIVPEKRSIEFPKFNADDFTSAMQSKFKLLQKSTAYRVLKMMESKNKATIGVMTSANYVDPKEFEDTLGALEKMNIQYQSAVMQIERLRDETLAKHSFGEKMENEKILLIGELARVKRDLENANKENSVLKNENTGLKNEIAQKEANSKSQNFAEMETLVNTLTAKLASSSKKAESLNDSLKDRDEKIKDLESKLEKIRLKRQEKSEDSEILNIYKKKDQKEKIRDSQQEFLIDPQFDNLFTPSSSSKRGKALNSSSRNPIRNSNNSDSKSTVRDLSEDQDQPLPLPTNKSDDDEDLISSYEKSSNRTTSGVYKNEKSEKISRGSLYQEARTNSTTPADKHKANIDGSLPTRVNSRDTPLARVDETKELKQKDIIKDDKNFGDIFKKVEKRTNESNKIRDEQKIVKKTEKKTGKGEKIDLSRYESEEDYQVNKSLQWENLIKGVDSGVEKIIVGKNGVEYKVCEKGVWTTDELKMIQVTNFSKAVQVSDGVAMDASDSKKSLGRNIYFLPYNPNNAYGLRGETYFHTKQQVFSHQPRIPDLASSVLFQQPYFLDKT